MVAIRPLKKNLDFFKDPGGAAAPPDPPVHAGAAAPAPPQGVRGAAAPRIREGVRGGGSPPGVLKKILNPSRIAATLMISRANCFWLKKKT